MGTPMITSFAGLLMLIYVVVIVYLLLLATRFVRAMEKIADKIGGADSVS